MKILQSFGLVFFAVAACHLSWRLILLRQHACPPHWPDPAHRFFQRHRSLHAFRQPSGRRRASGKPVVAFTPNNLHPGGWYPIFGFRFNGLSQGAAYGDDVQAATNYPAGAHHQPQNRARTHDHSSTAVASDKLVSTHYDVPANQETGRSKVEVVVNGIASSPVFVSAR